MMVPMRTRNLPRTTEPGRKTGIAEDAEIEVGVVARMMGMVRNVGVMTRVGPLISMFKFVFPYSHIPNFAQRMRANVSNCKK